MNGPMGGMMSGPNMGYTPYMPMPMYPYGMPYLNTYTPSPLGQFSSLGPEPVAAVSSAPILPPAKKRKASATVPKAGAAVPKAGAAVPHHDPADDTMVNEARVVAAMLPGMTEREMARTARMFRNLGMIMERRLAEVRKEREAREAEERRLTEVQKEREAREAEERRLAEVRKEREAREVEAVAL